MPVALVALLHPEVSRVRLVREHAANSLTLGLLLLGPLLVLGGGRGGPLEWLILVGVLLTLWLLLVSATVTVEAVRAWQGRRPWAPWAARVATWLPGASAPGFGGGGVRPAELGDVGRGGKGEEDRVAARTEGPDLPF